MEEETSRTEKSVEKKACVSVWYNVYRVGSKEHLTFPLDSEYYSIYALY